MSMDIGSLSRSHSAGNYINYSRLDANLSAIAHNMENMLNKANLLVHPLRWVVDTNYKISLIGDKHWYLNVRIDGDPTEVLHVTFHSGSKPSLLNIGRTHIKYNTPGQQQARIRKGHGITSYHWIFDGANSDQELCSTRIISELDGILNTLTCNDAFMQHINFLIIFVLNNYKLTRFDNKYLKYKTKYLKYKNKYLKLKKKVKFVIR